MPRRNQPKPHIKYQPHVPCSDKRRFSDESKALDAIEDTALLDFHTELYTYKCPYCSGWHLSSKKS